MLKDDPMQMPLNFEDFWNDCQKNWKSLSAQEKKFRKTIGLQPDRADALIAFRCLEAAVMNDPIL